MWSRVTCCAWTTVCPAWTVRRVVDKLLHAPTVRVKQLAGAPGANTYAEALRELFELDQQAVDAVASSEIALPPIESDGPFESAGGTPSGPFDGVE